MSLHYIYFIFKLISFLLFRSDTFFSDIQLLEMYVVCSRPFLRNFRSRHVCNLRFSIYYTAKCLLPPALVGWRPKGRGQNSKHDRLKTPKNKKKVIYLNVASTLRLTRLIRAVLFP